MGKVGRPKRKDEKGQIIYTEDYLCNLMEEYIQSVQGLPSLNDFIFKYNLARSYFFRLRQKSDKLKEKIQRLNDKAETMIVNGGLTGEYSTAMSIFLLKQPRFGYKDKPEEDKEEKAPVINFVFGDN